MKIILPISKVISSKGSMSDILVSVTFNQRKIGRNSRRRLIFPFEKRIIDFSESFFAYCAWSTVLFSGNKGLLDIVLISGVRTMKK